MRGLPDAAAVAATRETLDAMQADDKALFFRRSGMRPAAATAGYDLRRVPL